MGMVLDGFGAMKRRQDCRTGLIACLSINFARFYA